MNGCEAAGGRVGEKSAEGWAGGILRAVETPPAAYRVRVRHPVVFPFSFLVRSPSEDGEAVSTTFLQFVALVLFVAGRLFTKLRKDSFFMKRRKDEFWRGSGIPPSPGFQFLRWINAVLSDCVA